MQYIRFFNELKLSDVPIVGGKNASLGEMYQQLSEQNIKVPNGFATTADGYWYFLEYNNLKDEIASMLQSLDIADVKALARCGASIRDMLAHADMPLI